MGDAASSGFLVAAYKLGLKMSSLRESKRFSGGGSDGEKNAGIDEIAAAAAVVDDRRCEHSRTSRLRSMEKDSSYCYCYLLRCRFPRRQQRLDEFV